MYKYKQHNTGIQYPPPILLFLDVLYLKDPPDIDETPELMEILCSRHQKQDTRLRIRDKPLYSTDIKF